MSILVVDVGTSSVRAAVVTPDATLEHERLAPLLPASPAPGLVEIDAEALADAAEDCARAALADHGARVDALGITNQRGSTVLWDRVSGRPVGPGLGWQDLRTVGRCLELRGQGFQLAPNASATKLEWLLDTCDPSRERDLCFGTVDTWIAWRLSRGALHVTDASNALVSGLVDPSVRGWSARVVDMLRIPERVLPTIVDSSGPLGAAGALPGSPAITALVGDQQASLIGQACVRPGQVKITFGTGAMLDRVLGDTPPAFEGRGPGGTYPIVCHRLNGADTWGLEGIMLTAGSNVEWLRDDLGIIESSADSDAVAASCPDSGGLVYVPALLGIGTPCWDYGARGTVLGLTRGTGRAELVRAVLEGVAQRGADLVEAAETDAGAPIDELRVDGGMATNATFLQALADATRRPVEVAPVKDATTLGAGFLAGLAVGTWGSLDDVAATWRPRARLEPGAPLDRDRWQEALARARGWIPALSTIDL